jgi:RND superfamily putative drug exporter
VRDRPVAWDAALVFDSLGRAIAHRPRTTIVAWFLIAAGCFSLAFTGIDGVTVFDRLTTGASGVPGSESNHASEIIAENTTSGPSINLAVIGVDPTSTDLSGSVERLRSRLMSIPGVASVIDPFIVPDGPGSPAAAPLVAADHDGFLVVVELDPDLGDAAEDEALAEVEEILRAAPGELSSDGRVTGRVGGTSLILEEITGQVEKDLTTAERIALPIALLVMVLVFGGFLAAAMPMAGALVSIAVGLACVYGLSYPMEMEATVVNVVTVLGLGLSIDYGLLVVSRFREELHRVVDDDDGEAVRRRHGDGAVETALRATMRTAGRTVTFSAITVAISVCGLVVFEPEILRAFGVASAAVIIIAVTSALTLVPALLCLTKRRLVRPGLVSRIPALHWLLARTGDVTVADGAFARLATWVQRRPWRVLLGSLMVLALLAIPAAHIELRNSTVELLPPRSDQRAYVEQLARQYPGSTSAPVTVLAETGLDEATVWAGRLTALPDVASVDAPTALGPYVLIGVRPDSADNGGAVARAVVEEVRSVDSQFPTWVTGSAANQVDFVQALVDRAWWAAGIVAASTLILLFLMTGSVLIPIKALLTNVVSLSATFGVLTWVFQDGHLSGFLDFISTGGIETYVVALVVAFGFGLSMDYEVFLLSRVKEAHDAGGSNDEAVRLGLQRSGRIITSAAAIIIVVFAGFVFGKLLVIKEFGLSLAVAVLIDATLVRMLLVPATMTLLGRANWWAPRFMRPIHQRFSITH